MTRANKQKKEQEKIMDSDLPIVIESEQELINPFYRPRVLNKEVADYCRQQAKIIEQEKLKTGADRLRKCLELLKTGYPNKADELSKEFTEQQQIEYQYFLDNNFKRLKKVTMQRVEKIKEERKRKALEELEALEALIPVVTID